MNWKIDVKPFRSSEWCVSKWQFCVSGNIFPPQKKWARGKFVSIVRCSIPHPAPSHPNPYTYSTALLHPSIDSFFLCLSTDHHKVWPYKKKEMNKCPNILKSFFLHNQNKSFQTNGCQNEYLY